MTVPSQHPGEAAALEVRRRWELGLNRPVDDLLGVVERTAEIPVLIDQFQAPDLAGIFMRHADDLSFIAINADHAAPRQRFTLAHELGHHQMGHQPRVDSVTDVTDGGGDPQEVEANYFAAEFLCPRQAVTEWLSRTETAVVDADTAARLAMQYGMSFPSACFRLERAGAITPAAKRRMQHELAAGARAYVERHAPWRLIDEIERLAQDARSGIECYPRTPAATRSYAEQALHARLIDPEEHADLVRGNVPPPDADAWVA